MALLLITNCTNRKRSGLGAPLRTPTTGFADPEGFAQAWWQKARAHPRQVKPHELYCGRGYREAQQAAEAAAAPLFTVSAGFGLVAPDDYIPPYDFTLIDLAQQLATAPHRPSQQLWWHQINQARGRTSAIGRLLKGHPEHLAVLALSGGYLDLVQAELCALDEPSRQRLRILTASSARVPEPLADLRMPYDHRLDGPDSPLPGTKADFATRAARHFIEHIWSSARHGCATEHAQLVQRALAPWRAPAVVTRVRASDDEIRALIQRFWEDAGGRSAQMLRLLRDREMVACEQGRFAQLFRQVKEAR